MTGAKGQNDCWHMLLARWPIMRPGSRIDFLLLCVLMAKSHLLTLHCLKPHQSILLNNGGAKDSSLLRRKRLGGVSLFFAPPIVLKIRLEPEPNTQQQDLASMLSAQVSRHEQELEEIW
jgi:hypothetical protein